MATFGEFIKKERQKKKLNQSDFGQQLGIIMTDISKIENSRKKFPYASLEKLAEFLNVDYIEIKNLFVADILIEEANKYQCSDDVFTIAESQRKYTKEKNAKQGEMKF
ncbi:helix-turn-helix domain-containing protein [Sunxiuqinia rutila]|uniref:helix-turn-helix domain-containing protein n=1 Tax=Sunxiuqinia rutila TaxID=1397841 RepID=UPI003D36637F